MEPGVTNPSDYPSTHPFTNASILLIVIDNLIVHYAIDDATNEITIVTEAVRFDINHCLLIPDRFYHIGVVVL